MDNIDDIVTVNIEHFKKLNKVLTRDLVNLLSRTIIMHDTIKCAFFKKTNVVHNGIMCPDIISLLSLKILIKRGIIPSFDALDKPKASYTHLSDYIKDDMEIINKIANKILLEINCSRCGGEMSDDIKQILSEVDSHRHTVYNLSLVQHLAKNCIENIDGITLNQYEYIDGTYRIK